MNIREMFQENRIELGAEIADKDEALDRLIALQTQQQNVRDMLTLSREVREREAMGSSALSCRVAIPCVMHRGAESTGISAITVKGGVDYGAPDKRRVKLLFLISGKDGSDEYIEAKARLIHLLMDTSFTATLCAATSKEDFLSLIERRELARCAPQENLPRYDCSKFLVQNYAIRQRKHRFRLPRRLSLLLTRKPRLRKNST